MLKRKYEDKDGTCFADKGGCTARDSYDFETCGTYNCPFYKPAGCKDWIKRECKNNVELYEPEEYYRGKEKQR